MNMKYEEVVRYASEETIHCFHSLLTYNELYFFASILKELPIRFNIKIRNLFDEPQKNYNT